MIVRCTARLLKLLAPYEVVDAPPAADDWYANLIWIHRRKCLLMADTLFSVFVADVRKPQLATFGHYIVGTLATALADEGLAPDCLGPLDPTQVQVARTASRSVLGFMNDMAATSQYVAERAGGVTHLEIDDLPTTHALQPGRVHPPDRRRPTPPSLVPTRSAMAIPSFGVLG